MGLVRTCWELRESIGRRHALTEGRVLNQIVPTRVSIAVHCVEREHYHEHYHGQTGHQKAPLLEELEDGARRTPWRSQTAA